MPEMPSRAKALIAARPYRFLARRIIIPWVLQGEQPTGEGLEIGAGAGAMTAQLLTAFPNLRMLATDYDADLVSIARGTLESFGERATVERADAADLPFDEARFDWVLSAAMLHHVVAWERALAEAMRVLRPGGRLVGYDLLDTALSRVLHFGEGHDTRMLKRGQLETELGRLGVMQLRARPAVAGLALRFVATKPI